MVFFALCGSWVLHYLKIGDPAFKIAGGVILFLVTWDMLNSKRQARKRRETTAPALASALASAFAPDLGLNIADNAGDEAIPSQKSSKEVSSNGDQTKNVAIFPLAIPMLAGPAAIMSVMVVSADFSDSMVTSLIGYRALMTVMLATGLIMVLTAIAERIMDPRLSNLFSRVTAIILAALSVQHVIDGLVALQLITSP
jgi:multiple antibiotic resistance protein